MSQRPETSSTENGSATPQPINAVRSAMQQILMANHPSGPPSSQLFYGASVPSSASNQAVPLVTANYPGYSLAAPTTVTSLTGNMTQPRFVNSIGGSTPFHQSLGPPSSRMFYGSSVPYATSSNQTAPFATSTQLGYGTAAPTTVTTSTGITQPRYVNTIGGTMPSMQHSDAIMAAMQTILAAAGRHIGPRPKSAVEHTMIPTTPSHSAAQGSQPASPSLDQFTPLLSTKAQLGQPSTSGVGYTMIPTTSNHPVIDGSKAPPPSSGQPGLKTTAPVAAPVMTGDSTIQPSTSGVDRTTPSVSSPTTAGKKRVAPAPSLASSTGPSTSKMTKVDNSVVIPTTRSNPVALASKSPPTSSAQLTPTLSTIAKPSTKTATPVAAPVVAGGSTKLPPTSEADHTTPSVSQPCDAPLERVGKKRLAPAVNLSLAGPSSNKIARLDKSAGTGSRGALKDLSQQIDFCMQIMMKAKEYIDKQLAEAPASAPTSPA